MKKILFLFVLSFTFSFSSSDATDYNNCTCIGDKGFVSKNGYPINESYSAVDAGTWNTSLTQTISSTCSTGNYRIMTTQNFSYRQKIDAPTYYYRDWEKTQIQETCQTCPVGTVLNSITKTCDAPACPVGQHDDLSSSEIVHCVCDSGYPVYDLLTDGIKECVQPTCPPTSPIKSLPLKMENVDYATCSTLFNPVLGFDFEFLPDPNSSLTCCWSDSVKAPDGNSTEGDCGLNRTLDNNGNCVDIPRVPHDCPAETFYSYSDDTCLPIYPDSDGNQSQGGSNDGVNSDGSIRQDGDDTFYQGGGSESNESQKILLEYNNDEADNMLDAFSNTVTKKFSDFLLKTGADILKLYTISIPTMPSCGCENITYDFNLLNKQRSGTIDICSPMAQLFSILKPVLWFFFLIGMLFNFFMGRIS